MSEERLQEIKDSIEFQYTLAKAKGHENALLFTDEEKELVDEIERLHSIIKEVREMLEYKVDFHKSLDFYGDKELETQVYYNYVACLQDFDEIVEKYKVEENK